MTNQHTGQTGQTLDDRAALRRVIECVQEERWTSLALIPAWESADSVVALGFPERPIFRVGFRHGGSLPNELPKLESLTSLCLVGQGIGDAGAKAIAESLTELTSLDLASNQVGAAGAQAIAESLRSLTSLKLMNNRVGDAGAQAIAELLRSLVPLVLQFPSLPRFRRLVPASRAKSGRRRAHG